MKYIIATMQLDANQITFRKLDLSDLPLMNEWLNMPHVHEWYDKDKNNSSEEVAKRYGPKILGEKPTQCFHASYGAKPVGYLQTYMVNDWPEFGNHIGYDDATACVDLFIGDESFMGKGFGSLMLRKFLVEIVFSENMTQTCVIGPDPDNARAIKAYEKVGFEHTKTVHIPGEDRPTYIMEMKKRNLLKSG